jgi:type II secretory pathway component PulM
MDLTDQNTWLAVGVAFTALVQVYKLFLKNPKTERKADEMAQKISDLTFDLAQISQAVSDVKAKREGPK